MESVRVVLVRQVVENVEGQVDVDLVKRAFSLPELPDLLLLRCSLFRLH